MGRGLMVSAEHRHRLIDSLLEEVLGGDRPPDLSGEILRRAGTGGRRAWGWLTVGLAAAALLGIGVWIVVDSPSEGPADLPRVPASTPVEEPVVTSLPPEVRDFKGLVAGTIVSVDATGMVLKVTRVAGTNGNKAANPAWLVGRKVRMAFMRFKDGVSGPLLRQAEALKNHDGPVTADAWSERDEALIVTRLRAGDHIDRDR
jgi:hypothetical protein